MLPSDLARPILACLWDFSVHPIGGGARAGLQREGWYIDAVLGVKMRCGGNKREPLRGKRGGGLPLVTFFFAIARSEVGRAGTSVVPAAEGKEEVWRGECGKQSWVWFWFCLDLSLRRGVEFINMFCREAGRRADATVRRDRRLDLAGVVVLSVRLRRAVGFGRGWNRQAREILPCSFFFLCGISRSPALWARFSTKGGAVGVGGDADVLLNIAATSSSSWYSLWLFGAFTVVVVAMR